MNSLGRGDKQDDKKKASVITRETVGMTLLLFGAILFVIGITGPYLFGDAGVAITAFFVGLFGLFFYPLDLFVIYLGVSMVCGKRFVPVKWLLRVGFLTLSVFAVVHLATAERFVAGGYGEYLGGCWGAAGESAANGTGGGVLLGLIAYPVRIVLSKAGAYVVFSLLIALAFFFFLMGTPFKKLIRISRESRAPRDAQPEEKEPEPVTFDELSEPVRTAAPVAEQPLRAEAELAYYRRPSGDTDERRRQRDESREILYSGDRDRADDYLKNLIFSRDSQFNRRMGQGIAPEPEEDMTNTYTERSFSAEGDYSERYARSAEAARPAMPRKIVPAERTSFGEESFNYPQMPTYRAPSAPSDGRDPFSRDVPVTPITPITPVTPVTPVAPVTPVTPAPTAAPEEGSARIVFDNSAENEPVRPAYRAPEQEKPAAPARDARSLFRDTFSRKEESDEEEKKAPAQPERRDARSLFRDTFSRHDEAPARGEEEQDAEDENRIRRAFDELDDARRGNDRFRGEAPAPRIGFGDLPERSPVSEEPEEPSLPEREEPFPSGEPDETDYGASSFRATERREREEFSDANLFDDDGEFDNAGDYDEFDEPTRAEESFSAMRGAPARREAPAEPDTPAPAPAPHVYRAYVRPDTSVFNEYDDAVSVTDEEIERNSAIIVDTLGGFHIDAEVKKVTPASAVTRYDIDVPANVAVRTVMKRDQEIAMRLRARDGVNIYSNSEMGYISIEVPNANRATVGIRSILQADSYVNGKPDALMFAMGKDVEGRNVCGNICKMTHLLVAGSTGSGKSVCLNTMIISLICKYSPEDLRLILIDPKKVEFEIFDGLPHLMINEIISDAQKTIMALNWAIKEMERRYSAFSACSRGGKLIKDINEYNDHMAKTGGERLPKIVIVVDELADLMSVAKKDIEERIQRLAQKARAAGLHLVLATQRPSVDVITGVIKTNLPTRIAFRVGSEVDSRTILDESGAEKLLGNGDMLYHTNTMYSNVRVQGAFISSKEVEEIVKDIKANNEAYFDNSVADFINKSEAEDDGDGDDAKRGGEVDAVYIKALGIVVKLGTASISLIQRKCSVGYNHAGKIIEWMEAMNYISPFEGKAKPRTVLMTQEQYENLYGKLD